MSSLVESYQKSPCTSVLVTHTCNMHVDTCINIIVTDQSESSSHSYRYHRRCHQWRWDPGSTPSGTWCRCTGRAHLPIRLPQIAPDSTPRLCLHTIFHWGPGQVEPVLMYAGQWYQLLPIVYLLSQAFQTVTSIPIRLLSLKIQILFEFVFSACVQLLSTYTILCRFCTWCDELM